MHLFNKLFSNNTLGESIIESTDQSLKISSDIINHDNLIKSTSLIKIINDKLQLILSLKKISTKPIKVISIIGNGRSGKSTLLNCLLSHLANTNICAFDTLDTDVHCTFGLDMFYLESHDLVLVDCQGLKLDDSSHDPQLLLITYLISDLIIYNQKSILNNDVFDTLSPLASFINYLEDLDKIPSKPTLFFRLGDVELKFDPQVHLANTLAPKTDQYQNIRDCFGKLFNQTQIGITNSLDRSEKKLFNDKNFYSIITDPANMFQNLIGQILTIIGDSPSKFTLDTWLERLTSYIDKINSNQKINVDKLDTYQLLMFKEITEFKDAIDPSNYLSISVDATQEGFDANVVPRIEFKNNCLAMYETRFKLVNEELYSKTYDEISAKLMAPIDEAIGQVEKLAEAAIQTIIQSHPFKTAQQIYSLTIRNKDRPARVITILNTEFDRLMTKINIYYQPIVNQHATKYQTFIENCKAKLDLEQFDQRQNRLGFDNMKKYIRTNWSDIYPMLIKLDKKIIMDNYTKAQKVNYYDDTNIAYYDNSSLDNAESIPIIDNIQQKIMFDIFMTDLIYELLSDLPQLKDISKDELVIQALNKRFNSNVVYDIDFKTRTISDKIIYFESTRQDIRNFIIGLETEFLHSDRINKIIKTKFDQIKTKIQDNRCELISCNIITDPKCGCNSKHKKLCVSSFDLSNIKSNKIRYFVPYTKYYLRNCIKELKLVEFKKYLVSKFNKKFELDRRIMVEALIFNYQYIYHKNIRKLYLEFDIYYKLMRNQISGIKVSNK